MTEARCVSEELQRHGLDNHYLERYPRSELKNLGGCRTLGGLVQTSVFLAPFLRM